MASKRKQAFQGFKVDKVYHKLTAFPKQGLMKDHLPSIIVTVSNAATQNRLTGGYDQMWIYGLLFGSLLLVGALAYWLFIIAEGAYFGDRFVALLYDWGASRYDDIKDNKDFDEAYYLAEPILEKLEDNSSLILDVATGTGRLPLALVRQTGFCGHIVGLDLSQGMLDQAHIKLSPFAQRVDLIRQRADVLPFGDASFDAVTCLEALEFMPDPAVAIAEMVRVLRPGGLLLLTNRIDWESRLLVGRQCGRGRVEALLQRHPLKAIQTKRWQVYYDLIWARKKEQKAR